MTRLALAVFAALALALPASAQAQKTNAPPGNSAIDEYLETVPTASGNRPPNAPGARQHSSTLTGAQRRQLEQSGTEGKQLEALVDATAPAPATTAPVDAPHASSGGHTPTGASTPAPLPTREAIERAQDSAPSPLKATLAAAVSANDGGGLGIFFPVILLASLVGMIALAVLRRRPLAP